MSPYRLAAQVGGRVVACVWMATPSALRVHDSRVSGAAAGHIHLVPRVWLIPCLAVEASAPAGPGAVGLRCRTALGDEINLVKLIWRFRRGKQAKSS